jgi:hypothetical protein
VSKSKVKEVDVDPQHQVESFDNLQKFAKASKFQKTIISILMGLKGEKEDLK